MPILFPLGQVVVTRNCLNYAQEYGINLTELVERHANGDDGTWVGENALGVIWMEIRKDLKKVLLGE